MDNDSTRDGTCFDAPYLSELTVEEIPDGK
jgi:hypothetical protein